MKACVVDDDSTSRVLLGEFLKDEGWNVVLFNHPTSLSKIGTTLLDELTDMSPKLLVMDVRFGRDAEGLRLGLNTAKHLVETNKLTSNCLVVFVSQFGRDHIEFNFIEEALKTNGIQFHWFDKPVDFVKLKGCLTQFQ